ncbi:MAG: FtsX-like permease family protein, partial [Planctomycetaceae bacterium]|nr:FtsX-like permease family protein [Planctomycetaceae bacterium]
TNLETAQEKFTDALVKHLEIAQTGLAFRPVKFQNLSAARGTTDFSGLFFGFSFFLILSATILIGLLFRLGIERRASQVGLLTSIGYTSGQVRNLFLLEGGIVVLVGGLLGVAAAVGYAELMVYLLKTLWVGAIGTRFLDVYIQPVSLLAGFGISVLITLGTVWWALRQLKKPSTRDLLSGVVETADTPEKLAQRGKLAWKTSLICGGLSLVILIAALLGLIPASEAFMGISWAVVAFFIVGMAMLTASLSFLAWLLGSDHGFAVKGSGLMGTTRLGLRNAARNRMRSVLTVGLIASATFVIVAVAAGHRNPAVESPDKDSGNGGFSLVAESSTPINYNLNTPVGRKRIGLTVTTDQPDAKQKQEALDAIQEIVSFRVKPGENASCLNIYQTQLPTILGAPQTMIDRGG